MKEVSIRPKYRTGDILMSESNKCPLPLTVALVVGVEKHRYVVITDGVFLPWLLDIKKLDRTAKIVKVGKL
jgi:hypothetical protein